MAYVVTADIVMACTVTAYILMAYIVMVRLLVASVSFACFCTHVYTYVFTRVYAYARLGVFFFYACEDPASWAAMHGQLYMVVAYVVMAAGLREIASSI